MINIIVIGDIHFKTSNIIQSELYIEKITKLIENKNPDFVILLGDILDTFEKVHVSPLNKAYELINDIRKFCKVYIIVGNHDMVNIKQFLTTNHWMNAMKEWNNVIIVDKVIKEIIKNHKFIFSPYIYNGEFINALNTLGDETEWYDASCIFAHQEIFNCKMGAFLSVEGDKWDINYPNLISGHIHENQKLQENVYYPGASMDDSYGNTKNIIAYITFNDENKNYDLEEIDLNLPKKKLIYMDIDKVDDFVISDETQDHIKISIHGDYNEFKTFKKSKKYKELRNKDIKIVFKPKKIETKIKNEKLSKIIENNTENTNDFYKIINDIIEEQDDIYLKEIFNDIFNINNNISFE